MLILLSMILLLICSSLTVADSHETSNYVKLGDISFFQYLFMEERKAREELEKTVENLEDMMEEHQRRIKFLSENSEKETPSVASTYVRWGRTDCPGNGTELVYSGYIGGSWYNHKGGSANLLCLTKDPMWLHHEGGFKSGSRVYGAEYQFSSWKNRGQAFFNKQLLDFEAPCAVCRSSRPTAIMIPGRYECVPGWTKEYDGYIVGNFYDFQLAMEYTCLDRNPQTVSSTTGGDSNGVLFYFAEASCGSLKCPPYVDGAEITCVVCSK